MDLFAKYAKKTVLTAWLLIMLLILSAVPSPTPALALDTPISGTPFLLPSGVAFNASPVDNPLMTTNPVTEIMPDSALISGSVTSSGGNSVSEIGFVYAISPSPTRLSGTKVVAGRGAGDFSIRLMGLESGAPYYVRTYAVTSAGTTYGNEVSFTISPWYYLEVDDGSGGIYKIYLSGIGAVADEGNNNVKALVARYNESLGIDETQGRVYVLIDDDWIDSGTAVSFPGSSGADTVVVSRDESEAGMSYLLNVKIECINQFLEKFGINVFESYDGEIRLSTDGAAVGIDDNFFFGLVQKLAEWIPITMMPVLLQTRSW